MLVFPEKVYKVFILLAILFLAFSANMNNPSYAQENELIASCGVTVKKIQPKKIKPANRSSYSRARTSSSSSPKSVRIKKIQPKKIQLCSNCNTNTTNNNSNSKSNYQNTYKKQSTSNSNVTRYKNTQNTYKQNTNNSSCPKCTIIKRTNCSSNNGACNYTNSGLNAQQYNQQYYQQVNNSKLQKYAGYTEQQLRNMPEEELLRLIEQYKRDFPNN